MLYVARPCVTTAGAPGPVESVNYLGEASADEVCAVDEPKTTPIEVIWDTGCCDHVGDSVDFPGYEVQPSAGSKRGQNFTDAGGNDLPNEGQVLAQFTDASNPKKPQKISATFQITKVTRPLGSVSKILDNLGEKNAEVIFKKDRAFVRDERGRILATAERRGGLYIGTLQLHNPKHQDFRRQDR